MREAHSAGGRVRTVGLVLHGGRERAIAAAAELASWFDRRGILTRSLPGEPVASGEEVQAERFAEGLDLVVSIGGDGTLLRAARLAGEAGVPLLGVNVGRLGFLTEIRPQDAPDVLEQVLRGTAATEERTAVSADPVRAPWSEPEWALNEVIVEKRARHHLIALRATIAGEYVTTFSADGVIVATPTGSTAYSFSARGPIVSPKLGCLLLTPVSPHMVFDRPMVLAPDDDVTLEVLGDEPGLLSADGRPGLELPVGSVIRIRRSERPAILVRREGSPSFYALLREKFSLPGSAPHNADERSAGRSG